MSVAEVIYSSSFEPDRTKALDVLAFILVPASLFFDPSDDHETRLATSRMIYEAQRTALLDWYASHMGKL